MGEIKELPKRKHFISAVVKSFLLSILIIGFSLALGIWGYRHYYDLGFADALLNASMILTGMGPVNAAPDDSAKFFASFYALYSGVAFLSSIAVLFGPILHRFMHKFHLDLEE